MNKLIAACLFLAAFQAILIYGNTENKQNNRLIPIETTLLVNGRVNTIMLIITDNKNQQYQVYIRSGDQYECHHKPQQLKKITCYEILAANTTLTQNDLNTYAAFVFNADQKLEKYNFIAIKDKDMALNRARNLKNETLFTEISEQTVYKP